MKKRKINNVSASSDFSGLINPQKDLSNSPSRPTSSIKVEIYEQEPFQQRSKPYTSMIKSRKGL